jgi:hypothetical protein
MSASWKGLQKGGACKQQCFFAIAVPWSQTMCIISMKQNAIAFVPAGMMKIGFVTTTPSQVSNNYKR